MATVPRVGLTAQRVVDAALDLADAEGPAAVTLSALARQFGVRDASLHSHVRGLADLRERMTDVATGEFADVLGEAIAGRSGGEALDGFARAFVAWGLAHPGRYDAGCRAAVPGPGREKLVAAVAAVLRAYRFEPDVAVDAARLLRSTLHGYVGLTSAGLLEHARGPERSLDRIVGALVATLESWRVTPDR